MDLLLRRKWTDDRDVRGREECDMQREEQASIFNTGSNGFRILGYKRKTGA